MNRILTTGALGLMLAGATTLATAQPPQDRCGERGPRGDRPPLKQVIEKADADADGRVTYDDIATALPGFPAQAFERLDQNSDGVLTMAEVANRPKRGEGPPPRGDRGPRNPEMRGRFGDPEAGQRPSEFRGPDRHQGDGDRRERMERMRAADTNNDQQVSAEEFAAAFPEAPADRFQHMDRNGDGVLSREDHPDGAHAPGGPQGPGDREAHMAKLRAADTNEDRQISAEEFATAFPEAPADRFQHMDRNGDGVLSRDDRPDDGARPEGRGPRGGRGEGPDAAPGYRDRAPGEGRPGPGFHRNLMDDADANGDGQLSYEELRTEKPGFPKEVFQHLDRNQDGVLSADEERGGRGRRGPGGPGGHHAPPPPHE